MRRRQPLAVTDCLNFGNPEKPEIAWELAEAIEGMALACEALDLPVVSGNVSLYNETDGRAIHPTPVVGCVGLVDDVRRLPETWRDGDTVLLAGAPELRLDGSEYQALLLGGPAGRPPKPDLGAEAALTSFLWRAAPLATAVHDAAEGGLAVALAECAVASGLGAETARGGSHELVELYGEGGGQAVVAAGSGNLSSLQALAEERVCRCERSAPSVGARCSTYRSSSFATPTRARFRQARLAPCAASSASTRQSETSRV